MNENETEEMLSELRGVRVSVEESEEASSFYPREDEETALITMQEARLACRIDGTANDEILFPMKKAAEHYVLDAIGEEFIGDPRARMAALLQLQITYRPEEDAQGFLAAYRTYLLRQMRTPV